MRVTIPGGRASTNAALDKAFSYVPAIDHASPWGNSRTAGLLTLVFDEAHYHFTETYELSKYHNIRIEADNARFTCDADVVFRRMAENGLRHRFELDGGTFDSCSVELEGNSRNWHIFRELLFVNHPTFAIRSTGSSVINVDIIRCEFYRGAGGIANDFDQSTGWYIHKCLFQGSSDTDIRVRGDHMKIADCFFEQRFGDITKPHINFIGTSSWICDNRFGNEVGSSLGPPRDLIVIGELSEEVPTTETAAVSGLYVVDNLFNGVGQGAHADSGTNVIRMNNASHNMVVKGNAGIETYDEGIFFNHSKPNDGVKNLFRNNPGADITNFSRTPSLNSWSIL